MQRMLHAMKVQIKIKVTIKIEHEAELVSKQTWNTNIINARTTHAQNKNNPWNANIPSHKDLLYDSHQFIVARGVVLGGAAYSAFGIFPYCGGPKGYEIKYVGVACANETFSMEHCCGIIDRGNGLGVWPNLHRKRMVYQSSL